MKPNEINVAIAESVGWKHESKTCGLIGGKPPDYHGSYDAAAETLVAALAKEGWRCVCRNGLDGTWECEFQRPPTDATHKEYIGISMGETLEIHYHAAPTMPAAIAGCFLRVRGLWITEDYIGDYIGDQIAASVRATSDPANPDCHRRTP